MCDYNESEIQDYFHGYVYCGDVKRRDKTETKVFDSDPDFVQACEASLSNTRASFIEDKQKFLCTICGKGFNARHNLNVHEYQFHSTSSRVYACSVCTKTFSHSFLLTKHVRRTHESNYICDICKKSFKTRYNLSRHISRLH